MVETTTRAGSRRLVPIIGLVLALVLGAAARPEAPELVYLWSPSMPLSERGIPGIEEAAETLSLPVRVVRVEELGTAVSPELAASLITAGATVHYPTVTLVRGGRAVGNAIAGFKEAGAWEELLAERVEGDDRPPAPAPTGAPADMEVLWTHEVSPPPGAFFRRVPGMSWIIYDQNRRVYFRDVSSGEQFLGPGWIDFVPSPEGRLFVTPLDRNEGLEFYHAPEVLERGMAGEGPEVEAVWVDPEMNDQYPSVGILERDEAARTIRYRVLVSWFRGLAFRDYRVTWGETGRPSIEALTPKREACPGMDLSTPILAKDGREVAARHDRSGTTRILHLMDDGSCREVLDLGVRTSKVGFSDDGMRVAYSSPTGNGVESRTWVLDRASGETVLVEPSTSTGLVIPEMVGPDSVLIAVREPGTRGTAEFRLVCCVN